MSSAKGSVTGFIGLGIMGRPMASNLARAGFQVVVHNRSPGPMEALAAQGLATAETPRAVGEAADTVILMLANTPAVESVLFGDNGLAEGVAESALVIDMGTTAVPDTRRFAERLAARSVDYLDAPVSGGEVGAREGTLTIMAGGEGRAVERARPLFECLGGRLTHVGGTGAGQVAKAANQVIVGLTIGAVAEALTLARRAGVDPSRVREALMGGFAGSRILELHGQRMVERSFEPGGRSTTQRKDLFQALELARSLDLELPATALNMSLYDTLIAQGGGDLDHSALVKVIDGE